MLAARRLPHAAATSVRAVRTYASAAAGVQVSSTQQGIRVATYDDSTTPTAGLSVVLNAGARYETSETIGFAHYLKNFAFQATEKRTAFRIAREAELQGGVLYADLTRETIAYRARFLSEDWAYFAEVLAQNVTIPKFAHYVLPEVRSHVEAESAAALADPKIAVLEALHQAAFRQGLGNSLYAKVSPNLSTPALKQYLQSHLSGLTVVGQGIEHAALVETIERVFEGIQLTPQSKTTSAKYFGGDIHLDVPAAVASGNAVCAVAFPTTTAERSAARALRHLLGGESRLKWAQGQSPLAKAAQAHNAEVQGLNLEYSDAGLLGFIVHAPAGKIRSAVRDLAAELKKVASGDVSAEALKRAISTARFEAANAVENVDARLAKLGNDIATTGASVSLTDSIADIASIQSANVVDLAKRLVASRPTLAAAGNQHDLPYADELGL